MSGTALSIVSELVHSLGLAALVVMGFGAALRHAPRGLSRSVLCGIVFGCATLVAMLDPLRQADGVVVDARAITLSLAGLFGGWPAGLIAGACAAAFRLWQGGIGAPGGVLGIVISVGVGLVAARLAQGSRHPLVFLALGGGVMTMSVSVFLLPWEIASKLFVQAAPGMLLMNLVGVPLLGLFLAAEEKRFLAAEGDRLAAETDELTKLSNRRAIDRYVLDMERSDIGRHFALAIFDIDRFKAVNDTYGHAAGDRVLAGVSEILSRGVRSTDRVFRFGGEEIVVVMPRTGVEAAARVAEKLRRAVEKAHFEIGNVHLEVTVSAGVAVAGERHATFDEVLALADSKLYAAKSAGRNRIAAAA